LPVKKLRIKTPEQTTSGSSGLDNKQYFLVSSI